MIFVLDNLLFPNVEMMEADLGVCETPSDFDLFSPITCTKLFRDTLICDGNVMHVCSVTYVVKVGYFGNNNLDKHVLY